MIRLMIIAVLIGIIVTLSQPCDCSDVATDARMNGFIDGMRQTTNLFKH